MPLVIGDALGRAADPAGPDPGQQPQGAARASTGASGLADPEAVLRAVDKLDKIGPAEVADAAGRDRRRDRRAGEGRCLALAAISAAGRVVRRRGARARRQPTRCSTRAWPSWPRSSRRPATHAPGLCVADLRIARGLDYYTGTVYETQLAGLRAVRLGLLRRPLRQPGQLRQRPVPRRRHLDRRVPAARAAVRRGRADASAARCRPACWSRCPTRSGGRDVRPDRGRAARRGASRPRWRRRAAKFGKQIRYAERRGIPYVWFPGPTARRTR